MLEYKLWISRHFGIRSTARIWKGMWKGMSREALFTERRRCRGYPWDWKWFILFRFAGRIFLFEPRAIVEVCRRSFRSFKTPQKIISYLFNNDDFILFCNFFLLGHGQLFLGGRLFGMYRDFCEKFLASFAFFGHGYFLYRQLFVQFRELLTGDKQFAEPAIQAVALKDKSSMYNRMAPRKNSRLISRVYWDF